MVAPVNSLTTERGEIALRLIRELAEAKATESNKDQTSKIITPTVNAGKPISSLVSDNTQASLASLASQWFYGAGGKPSDEQVAKLVEYYSSKDAPMTMNEAWMIRCSDWAKNNLENDGVTKRQIPQGMTSDQFRQLVRNMYVASLEDELQQGGNQQLKDVAREELDSIKKGNYKVILNGEESRIYGTLDMMTPARNGNFGMRTVNDDVDWDLRNQRYSELKHVATAGFGGFGYHLITW